MRMTQEDFERAFKLYPCKDSLGRLIEYREPSKNRTIPVTVKGETYYTSNLLKAGNLKLGKNIWYAALPPVLFCPEHSLCGASCYVQTERYTARNKKMLAAALLMTDPAEYFTQLYSEVIRIPADGNYIRPHEAGDYHSPEQLEGWRTVMRATPQHHYFDFTKTLHRLEMRAAWKRALRLDNFSIMNSLPIIDGRPRLNYGPKPYMLELAARTGLHLCSYGMENLEPAHCGLDCFYCMENGIHTPGICLFGAHGSNAAKAPGAEAYASLPAWLETAEEDEV